MIRTLLSIAALCLFAAPVLADDPAPKKPGAVAQPKKEGDKAAQPEKKKEGDAAKPEKKKEGDAAKPEKKKKEADPSKGPQLRGLIKVMENKVQFSEDQKAKIDSLVAELQPKYAEASKALKFTEEQQAARKAAQEKAKAEGLKAEAATKFVHEAMKLTPEQKSALEAQAAVANQFREKVRELLTPEQKASLKKKHAA